MSYRENFKISGIPSPAKITGAIGNTASNAATSTANAAGSAANATANAGKSAANATANAGKSAGSKITNKVLGPIADFFKKIWRWFKWVLSVCCCVCIVGCCLVLGIPQMALSAMK